MNKSKGEIHDEIRANQAADRTEELKELIERGHGLLD